MTSTPSRARRRVLLVAAAVVAALAVAGGAYAFGRSGGEPTAAPTSSSPSASAPPVDGGTFTSPTQLVEALNRGGIACSSYTAIASPRGATARGNCLVNGDEYTVGIYASPEDARAQPDVLAELLEGVADVDLVLGQNWTVGCPDEPACRKVAAVLGGEVFHTPM